MVETSVSVAPSSSFSVFAGLPEAWRGPNDPPGTRFRAQQTFEIYGYHPREIIEVSTIDPQFLPTVEPKPTFETDPVMALIKARILVDDCVFNRHDWSTDEIRPYVVELQSSLESLRRSLNDSDAFEMWMAREGLS